MIEPGFNRKRRAGGVAVGLLLAVCQSLAGERASIPVNDRWDAIRPRGRMSDRELFAQAGRLLGDWAIELAGVKIDGAALCALAERAPDEPFVRVVREGLRRPVDVVDLLLFIDDVLRAGKRGLRNRPMVVTPGRARRAGILIHPDDVFRRRPRRYPHRKRRLNVDRPEFHPHLSPAKDGDPLGPNWAARYRNPISREDKLRALAKRNPSGTLAERVRSLIVQLEAQGCEVGLYTTVRNRRRGYLMWGSFHLGRQRSETQTLRVVHKLERCNAEWGLDVPIRWSHPRGWRATVEAARRMAEAYPVTFATEAGAKRSRHYDGEAVDLTAIGLPRRLTLKAPDGAVRSFDLADRRQSRDLNLTPELIAWIERHFELEKLKSDYPHWNDAARKQPPPK